MNQRNTGNTTRIVDYRPELAAVFKALNEAWITELWEMDEHDIAVLNDPEREIIDTGGRVFFAETDGQVVGTGALICHDSKRIELAKMAVEPEYRGLGIGKMLALYAIQTAKALGATEIFLKSNRTLGPALALYRQLGFKECEEPPVGFSRCDVQMVMPLPAAHEP